MFRNEKINRGAGYSGYSLSSGVRQFQPDNARMINVTDAMRNRVAGSLEKIIPTTNVPAAPIPVQIAQAVPRLDSPDQPGNPME
jgi:hypothetical protein